MNTATEILTNAELDDKYWGKKIIAAEKRGHFTDSNKKESMSWVTCACGKTSALFEVHDGYDGFDKGEPLDEDMHRLGCYFHEEVRDNNILEAAKVLVRIEGRAGELHADALLAQKRMKQRKETLKPIRQ